MPKIARILIIILIFGCLAGVYVTWRAIGYRENVNIYLDKYINHVRQLSGREQYADLNRKLVSDTLIPGRVVVFGSQVVANWNLSEYFPDYQAIGRGIAHQSTAGMLLRFRPDVVALYPQAVIIETASFNFRYPTRPQELFDHVMAMVDQSRQNGIVPIVMTAIPPLKDSSHMADFEEETHGYKLVDSIRSFNRMLRNSPAMPGIVLDAALIMADSDGFLSPAFAVDAINLSPTGYAHLTEAIAARLDSLVIRPQLGLLSR
jgi:hypothetical protein